MIKKLRKRFLYSNLFLVTIIIFIFFLAITLASYSFERQQTEEVLTVVLENIEAVPDAIVINEAGLSKSIKEEDTLSRIRTVILIAQTDELGKTTAYAVEDNAEIPAEVIYDAIGTAVANEDFSGSLNMSGYALRYLKLPNGMGGYKIAFSDSSMEIVTIRFLARAYSVAAFFFFAIMFIFSDYMAHKAIAPVEKTWKHQNQFVADASHELKTPLTVILANMDIMLANPGSTIEEQQKWIENTKSEAKRMTDLVNDMLFLARGDAGHELAFNFMDINASALVEDCVLTFESVAFEKGVELTENITEDVIIRADEAKLKQAIMILIDNALKYVNDRGQILVSLKYVGRYVGRVPGKSFVKISVSNTGTPIPKEKQAQVFERFFRVDESRTREKGGYGLGLAIAANIMQAHEGNIALDYSDYRGTCFSLTLPVKQSRGFRRKRKRS